LQVKNATSNVQRQAIDLQKYHVYFIFYVREEVLRLEG